MTDIVRPFAPSHPLDRTFFLVFLIIAVVAVAGGFLPRLETIFSGERDWPPFAVHVHAVLFYGWIAFLGAQIVLVRSRNMALHKRMGLFGLGLAAAMVVVGAWMALTMAEWHWARGAQRAAGFLPVPLTDLVIFTVLIGAAALLRRDGAAHKRLILMGTTQILGAGFGRMNLYDAPATPFLPALEPMIGLYSELWIILAAAVIFDVVTRGRPHPVYLIGIPFMLAMQFAASNLLTWPGWLPFIQGALDLS